MTTNPQCHLFVIFAREAHQAVLFRRGPRLWTQLILWNTDVDTFIEGQWFKGTIYVRRCDVSPDASKLIYFAAKHYKRFNPEAAIRNNWTAISRPPYLTALAMWDTSDTWGGGGYFKDNKTVYVTWTEQSLQAHHQHLPEGFEAKSLFPKYDVGVEDGIYYHLLLEKRGWTRIEGDFSWNKVLHQYESPRVVWRKDNSDQSHSLLWTMPLGGPDRPHEFKLRRHRDNQEAVVDSGEWADWDHRGRLIYCNSGRLFMGTLLSDQIESVQLADFNSNKPTLIQSPAWARTWDEPSR
jgi:hypothetical protein